MNSDEALTQNDCSLKLVLGCNASQKGNDAVFYQTV